MASGHRRIDLASSDTDAIDSQAAYAAAIRLKRLKDLLASKNGSF